MLPGLFFQQLLRVRRGERNNPKAIPLAVERKLSPEAAKNSDIERLKLDEKTFRYLLNDNAMATEKTAEGIRVFAADTVKLQQFIAARL